MAQDDRPYGGRIQVLPDGSVRWDVRNRYFPTQQDTDGEIKYAIRVITAERNIIASADGKCIVTVPEPPATGHLVFLIVSGYDTESLPPNAVAVGRSYFITADWSPRAESDPQMPGYKVLVSFDDYDLEHAGLAPDTDATALELCHLVYARAPESSTHHSVPVGPGGVTPEISAGNNEALFAAVADAGEVVEWNVKWNRIRDQGSDPARTDLNRGPRIKGARSMAARGLVTPEMIQIMWHNPSHP